VTLQATEQPIDTRSAAGKAFLDMLGVFAEFETNLRRECSWTVLPWQDARRLPRGANHTSIGKCAAGSSSGGAQKFTYSRYRKMAFANVSVASIGV
jgi:hypothetical protein